MEIEMEIEIEMLRMIETRKDSERKREVKNVFIIDQNKKM